MLLSRERCSDSSNAGTVFDFKNASNEDFFHKK